MKLGEMLRAHEDKVLEEAYAGLQQLTHAHYERRGEEFTRQRLAELFSLVVTAIDERDLAPLSAHAEEIAAERFASGFDISEVQAAFNSLEIAMWRQVVVSTAPEHLAEAIGLLSTVMGFAKDTLARGYISLATQRRVGSLDMSALFSGLTA